MVFYRCLLGDEQEALSSLRLRASDSIGIIGPRKGMLCSWKRHNLDRQQSHPGSGDGTVFRDLILPHPEIF